MNREVRTNLDHFPTETHSKDEEIRKSDSAYKQRCKGYHDKRHNTRERNLKAAVVVKREHRRKAQTPYEPYVYIVTQTKGSKIEAKRIKDGRAICRDASRFKPLKTVRTQGQQNQDTTHTAETKPGHRPHCWNCDSTTISTPRRAEHSYHLRRWHHRTTAATNHATEEQTINTVDEQLPDNIDDTPQPHDQEPPTLRRSERQTQSTFDGRWKDYIR